MRLSRTARRHQAATDPVLWWEFMPGDRVMVVEGFLGTVVSVEDGLVAGTEQYVVELDSGMGGGDYGAGELTKVEGTVAKQAGQNFQKDQVRVTNPTNEGFFEALSKKNGLGKGEFFIATVNHIGGDYYDVLWLLPEDMISEVTLDLKQANETNPSAYTQPDAGVPPAQGPHDDLPQMDQMGQMPQMDQTPPEADTGDYLDQDNPYTAVASDDYPMLSEILMERPPLPHSERIAKTASVPVRIRRAAGYIVEDENGLVVAGPFVSRLDAEAAERAAREEGQSNLVITRQGMAKGTTQPFKDSWWLERFLVPLAEDMIARQPEHLRYDPATGKGPSYDWCRFRRTRRCFYPRSLNEEASDEAGYAVWVPEDRGFCPRDPWEGELGQMSCPVSEPGPNAKPPHRPLADATIAWEDGGQRYDDNGNPIKRRRAASKTAADEDGWYRSAVSSGDAYGRITGRNHYWKDGEPLCGAKSRGIPPRRGEKTIININNCGACAKRVEKERLA